MKRNPNINRFIMFTIIVVGLIIAGISAVATGVEPIHTMFIVGGIVAFSGIIFGIIFVRCPACGKLLNLRGLSSDYCPHCGKKF